MWTRFLCSGNKSIVFTDPKDRHLKHYYIPREKKLWLLSLDLGKKQILMGQKISIFRSSTWNLHKRAISVCNWCCIKMLGGAMVFPWDFCDASGHCRSVKGDLRNMSALFIACRGSLEGFKIGAPNDCFLLNICGGANIAYNFLFHSWIIFEAYLINSLRSSEV